MKTKRAILILTTAATLGIGLTWIQAQNETPPPPEETAPQTLDEKWLKIKSNNAEMQKTMADIETNLQFIKSRSMAGGKQ